MVLSDISIRRPVLSTVMSLMIVLVGVISFNRLTIREYPKIDEPVVNVETRYRGATAEIVETQITQPLEESLAGIEGIDVMSSISREELSQITVRFKVDRDVDAAANDVRDRVFRVRSRLPDEIDEPIIAKVEADAQPIIYLAFSSDRHTALEVTDYADRFVKDRLQSLPGVADAIIFGERRYAMRVWLDRERMAGYALAPQDVEDALEQQNIEIPAGRIESLDREFTVLSQTDLQTARGFENIVLKNADGYLVRLRDVARVEVGPEDVRKIVRFNGESAVALGVVKQSVANPLDISKSLREALPRILADLPQGMKMEVAYDSSVFIDRSISAVFATVLDAIGLVVLVIFLFLRTVRATLIPLVTIPVSLVGAFTVMYAFNFSVNTLTLLAMVLAIGLVVDDAIVMLENIHRHIERGTPPLQAAFKGSKEIAFAVIAMTLTLAAVYAPIGFMEGRTGRLFREFAMTLAGAVVVSGFVALTLSPMMCSRMLSPYQRHGRLYLFFEDCIQGLNKAYRYVLTRALRQRALVLLVGLGVALWGARLLTVLHSELAPVEDRGTIVGVASAPEGATVEYTDRYVRRMESIVKRIPEVEKYFAVAGFPQVTNGIMFARLVDWDGRSKKQQAIARELMPKFGDIPGVLAFPLNPPSLGQSPRDQGIQFVVQTTASYPELEKMVERLLAEARKFPGMFAVDSDLRLNKPQLKVTVHREKAADAGIDVETLGRALETMLGGKQVTRFKRGGKQYEVILQVADVDRRNPRDITRIYVRGGKGEMILMSNLVAVQESVAPKELNHFNKLRSATIAANVSPGYALGDALTFLEETADNVLPAAAQFDYAGQSREFKESAARMYVMFLLALGFIFLALAAQFESFVAPLVIMLTVPLSMTGALWALKLTGNTLNIYSQIGLVTLVGLITKHGILIVEFANQMQAGGKSRMEAAIEASALRLRPILMTTGAMVFGTVPLALAHGAGAESRQAIGWIIVGGLVVGTFFTLFVIPCVYTLMVKIKPLAAKENGEPAGESNAPEEPAELSR